MTLMHRFPTTTLPAICCLVLLCGMTGCRDSTPSDPDQVEDTSVIDLSQPPLATDIISVVKDGMGYVLLDILPEVPKLQGHSPSSQQEYLRRRALQILIGQISLEKDLQGQKEFLVRMIVLISRDEYNRVQWATAPELARFVFAKPEGLTVEAVAGMALEDIERLIQQETVSLEHAKEIGD